MSIYHHIAATALMLFLIRGLICTEYHICTSYAIYEDFINERTKTSREDCRNMVSEIFIGNYEYGMSWNYAVLNVLTGFCAALDGIIKDVNIPLEKICQNFAEFSTVNTNVNEICNGPTVSDYLLREINDFHQVNWNLTEDCINATQQLRDECIEMERNTKIASISFIDGPRYVASRMNKAMDQCRFRRNFCEENPCSETNIKWKLYFLIIEFLERIHPRVKYEYDHYTILYSSHCE